jgi:hypothetical protein
VEQQYLPDALVDRVYYVPSDQGMEQQIGARLDRLREGRAEAKQRGGPRRAPAAQGATRGTNPMRIADGVMKSREEVKKKTAAKQKADAKDAG